MRPGHITVNFTWQELGCHDGTDVPIEYVEEARGLCELLELLRADLGNEPLVVVSGYRSIPYNERIGGAKHSYHCHAMAADVRPVQLSKIHGLNKLLVAQARTPRYAALGGHGVYSHWVHVDTRPRRADGEVVRWFGDGVGAEKVYDIENP